MLALQILIDGFAVSALYALGATGFTLIFGVSGVLNLSHGAIMVLAAVAAWAAASVFHVGTYAGALIGVAVALVAAFATYFAVGDHDSGVDRVFLHQQRQDGAADRRGRRRYPRRQDTAKRNLYGHRLLA